MILDMQNIYIKYFDQTNKAHEEYNKIRICILWLEQELYISTEEREQAVFLVEQQTIKIKRYERMIDILQSLVLMKSDIPLSSIKKPID